MLGDGPLVDTNVEGNNQSIVLGVEQVVQPLDQRGFAPAFTRITWDWPGSRRTLATHSIKKAKSSARPVNSSGRPISSSSA